MAQGHNIPASWHRGTRTLQHGDVMMAQGRNAVASHACNSTPSGRYRFAVSHYCNAVKAKCCETTASQRHTVAILSIHSIVMPHRANQPEVIYEEASRRQRVGRPNRCRSKAASRNEFCAYTTSSCSGNAREIGCRPNSSRASEAKKDKSERATDRSDHSAAGQRPIEQVRTKSVRAHTGRGQGGVSTTNHA